MTATGYSHLAGTELPAGAFTIPADENAQVARIAGDEPLGNGLAHELYAYVANQRGIGISVAELLALADFDMADGPMLGACRLEYGEAPLRVGVPYEVRGEILDVTRKQGRSGTFDVLRFRERLVDGDGAEAAAVTNTFILPRRSES